MVTSQETQPVKFRIGDFTVDADDNTVSTTGQQRHIEPKAMQVLLVLVSRANKTVDRQELLKSVWGDRVVVDEALTRVISQLRLAFQDNKSRSLIQTVPKKGYRLNAQVEWLDDEIPEPVRQSQVSSKTSSASSESAVDKAGQSPEENRERDDAQAMFTSPASTYVPKSTLRRRLQGLTFVFAIVLIVTVVTWLVDSSDSALIEDTPSVAVLPLIAQGDNQQSQYLAEGLAEELMDVLSNRPDLHVPSRYSTFAYAQQYQKLSEIAGALDVRYLIEGTVRSGDGEYSIVVRLIDAKQDKTLWSTTYEDEESTLTGVSDSIANDIINQLLPDANRRLLSGSGSRVNNVDAYQAYLKGTYWLMNGKTSEWFLEAERAFNEAIEADPTYADAYGSLAYIYARFNYHDTYLPQQEATDKAEQAIATALSLDPENLQAHLASAIIATAAQAFSTAETELDRALKISPENATALYLYSELRLAQNDFDSALDYAKKAVTQDPLSPWVNVNLSIVHYWRGEWDSALNAANNAISIDDEYTWAYVWKAKVLHQQGRLADAITAMHTCLDIDASSPVNNAYTGLLYLEADMPERAAPLFTATAALFGDSTDARFWKGFVRFAYEQQNSDVAIAMLEDLTLLNNRIFSLIPLLTSLYQQHADVGDGLIFLSQNTSLPEGQVAVVNYLNLDVAAGWRVLSQSAEPALTTPFDETDVLDSEFLPRIGEIFWLLKSQPLSDLQAGALTESLQTGWPEYLWMTSEPTAIAKKASRSDLQQAIVIFEARRSEQALRLKIQQH